MSGRREGNISLEKMITSLVRSPRNLAMDLCGVLIRVSTIRGLKLISYNLDISPMELIEMERLIHRVGNTKELKNNMGLSMSRENKY